MAPDLEAMLRRADAAMVIGDPALRISLAMEADARRGEAGEQVCAASSVGIADDSTLHIYDIVEQWRKISGLPAVLAVWAARRDVVTQQPIEDFQLSRKLGMRHLSDISLEAAAGLNLAPNKLQRYLTENINFSLDEENLRGLTAFFAMAAELNLIPRAKPLEIAAPRNDRQRDTAAAFAKPR